MVFSGCGLNRSFRLVQNIWAVAVPRYFHHSSIRTNSSRNLNDSNMSKGSKNVWAEIAAIRDEHNALDICMGQPDFMPKPEVVGALTSVLTNGDPTMHQYGGRDGVPVLLSVLARTYSRLLERTVDAGREVKVTLGAIEGLFNASTALFKPGDEVLLVEPHFPPYATVVRRSGAVPVYVQLKPGGKNSGDQSRSEDWVLDMDEVEKVITNKTKGLIFNNPHNPVGKLFSRTELEAMAAVCIKHDLMVITDEVYEWLVYDQQQPFIRMACIPGMYDRTVTVGSAGKSFSVTGWRVGWTIAPPKITDLIKAQYTSSMPTPIQVAVANLLETELSRLHEVTCFFTVQCQEFRHKMELLYELLNKAGLNPVKPMSGYFILADITEFDFPCDSGPEAESRDLQFVKWIAKTQKLSAAPADSFFSTNTKNTRSYVRFCFIKDDETLKKAKDLFEA